jgi:hypothetical protein
MNIYVKAQLVEIKGLRGGEKSLDITGPGLLGGVIPRDVCNLYWDRCRIVHIEMHTPILIEYDGYRDDCKSTGSVHYTELWPNAVFQPQNK